MMRRSNVGLFLCLALLALSCPSFAEDGVWDMAACVKRGIETNEQLQASEHGYRSAREGKRAALGEFGPKVTLNYGYTRLEDYPETRGIRTGDRDLWRLNLNVHQPLFAGFKILSSFQKASLAEELKEQQFKKARLDLILEIQKNFLDLLKAREALRSAEDSLARLESQLKVSKAFFDVGLKPKLDLLQAEVEAAKAKRDLIVAKNTVEAQTVRLNTLLTLPVGNKTDYSGTLDYIPFIRTYDECLSLAETQRPDLVIATKSVAMARKDAMIAASPFFPQVGADYNYYRYGDSAEVDGSDYQKEHEWTAGVSLKWELFSCGTTVFAYRQAREDVFKLEAELADLKNNVAYEVKAELLSLEAASELIAVAKKAVEASKESYRMAQARYKAQVGTNTDVLDAQAKLSSSESDLTKALADYQQSLAKLYVAMGEERASLSIGQ